MNGTQLTVPDLYRKIADLTEQNEALAATVQELEAELAGLRGIQEKVWYTPIEAAAYLGMAVNSLKNDRVRKEPRIPFHKNGPKLVLYRREDLDAAISAKVRKKHSNSPGGK
jgi:hypothetical protein